MEALEAEFLPTVATTGVIKKIGAPRQSERSDYTIVDLEIELEAGPRKSIRTYLVFLPDWLKPDFQPKSLTERRDRNVYRNNINSSDRRTTLAALAGDDWAGFVESTFGMFNSNGGTFDGPEFHNILNSVGNGQQVLVELTQERQKTDELTEDGRPIYRKTENYTVGKFHEYKDTVVVALEKRAGRAREAMVKKDFDIPSFVVAWDEGGDEAEG